MNVHPKYPIGMQSFSRLREAGSLYIDKTEFFYKLFSLAKYIFLGRPRRFGKSLFLSTLESYFKGEREYFKGLKVAERETEWIKYPVIHLDMSSAGGAVSGSLRKNFQALLQTCASDYGEDLSAYPGDESFKFGLLIKRLAEKTGQPVAVLIDEYDVPIHGVDPESDIYRENQSMLRELFMQCKSYDAYIKFCMVTGVTRFNQMNLFSGPNNFKDISMDERFATICGFTHEELTAYCREGIEEFASVMNVTTDSILDSLTKYYDGYRFTARDVKVFNPLSVMMSLSDYKLEAYWVSTGLTSVFVSQLMNPTFQFPEITDTWYDSQSLTKIYDMEDPISLMFQSGYLTISEYDRELDMYKMQVPNQEVMRSLTQDLIPAYMGKKEDSQNMQLVQLRLALMRGDVDRLMDILKTILSRIAYHLFPKDSEPLIQKEHYYHTVVYLIFMMLRSNVLCELAGSKGRSDLVAQTDRYVYIFEFKIDNASDGNIAAAFRQIEERGYATRFKYTGRKIYGIAVIFSVEDHDIADWAMREY